MIGHSSVQLPLLRLPVLLRLRALARLLFAAVLCAGASYAADMLSAVAIVNARVVTVSGPVLSRGTVILRNALIEAVGENVPIPPDAEIVDGEGLTVYPGLIDALSNWGLPPNLARTTGRQSRVQPPDQAPTQPSIPSRGPEDRPATTTWVRAADELVPNDRRFDTVRQAGFTAAAAFPMRGIFAGQGAMVRLAGQRARDMVLVPSLGQYITLTPNPFGSGFPSALMGVIAYIRQMYLDADRYALVKAAYTRDPRGMIRPEYDRGLEGLLESKRILLPADRQVEMDRMLHLAVDLKQPAILYGGHDGYRAAELLKKSGATVLVSLNWPEGPRDPDLLQAEDLSVLELRAQAPSTPAILKKAGVPFAFYSDGIEQPRDFQRAVKKAMDAGLSREDAVRALTLSAAEIWGVADRLGSIDAGKIANLVVTRGQLFDEATTVEMVFIDGAKYNAAPESVRSGAGEQRPVTRNNRSDNQ